MAARKFSLSVYENRFSMQIFTKIFIYLCEQANCFA